MKNFYITSEQEKAFKKVANAIKKAKKAGLVFYGKSDSLVAYTKDAAEYVDEDLESCFGFGTGSSIDCISELGLINDSGADDYPCFRTELDENKYT